MDGRGAVDELSFLLVRVAVVAVPAGLGYAKAGALGLAVGFAIGLAAAGVFWAWTTASGARAAARTDLGADPAEPPVGETDGRQVEGPGSDGLSGR